MNTRLAGVLATCAFVLAATVNAQLPTHPQNLRVLPKTLSTDSVFSLMLGVADGLGVSCGYCHVGGDRATWDSTHFESDAMPMKITARAMFRLTDRLNTELLPAIVAPGRPIVQVTCATCHRGAPRPVTIDDTLTRILDSQGVDSLLAAYQRIRERSANRMTWDLREGTLNGIASKLIEANRFRDAARVLDLNAHLFPTSANVAYRLGVAYEKAGEKQLAITQFHRALSIQPNHQQADQHLRALIGAPRPH